MIIYLNKILYDLYTLIIIYLFIKNLLVRFLRLLNKYV